MPDVRQVRMAAFHVMRERGLAGTTIAAIRARLMEVGVRAGSNRDLVEMVRAWKTEQKIASKLPPQIIKLAEDATKMMWETIMAELALQRLRSGGAAFRSRQPPRRTEAPDARARLVAHKKGGTPRRRRR